MKRSLLAAILLTLPMAVHAEDRPASEMRPLITAFRAAPERSAYAASGMCRVRSAKLLDALGADEAFWIVSCDGPIEQAIQLAVHARSGQWWNLQVQHEGGALPKTAGTESLAYWDGAVYLCGSHATDAQGAADPSRQFFASFREETAQIACINETKGVTVSFRAIRLPEGTMFQAINDVLKGAPQLPPDEEEQKALTQVRYAREGDRLISINGFEFLNDGSVLLGLGFPTTDAGTPLLLHMGGFLERIEDPNVRFRFEGPWTIVNAGSKEVPHGIDALRIDDRSRLHVAVSSHGRAAGHYIMSALQFGASEAPVAVLWNNAGLPDSLTAIDIDTSGTVLYLSGKTNEIFSEAPAPSGS